MKRRVAFLIFPDFQLLDAAGPISAFEIAERYVPGSFELRVIAKQAGAVTSTSGASMNAVPMGRPAAIDTLIVVGGEGTRATSKDERPVRFVAACGASSRRVASVCSGAYILAATGLLDGRAATTHWTRSDDFARKFPRVKLDADRIFVKAGKFWSSAGITAGIDLSLAVVGGGLGGGDARPGGGRRRRGG